MPKTIESIEGFHLVVVGGGDFSEAEQEQLHSIKERVHLFLGIDTQKLNILYNNAFCLFYPSSYEGFGIPIVEAMKAGCPVISTNTSSIPEVAGDAAILVNEIELELFIKSIRKLEDSSVRDEMIAKGLIQSEKFSWDKCFEETMTFYQEIYERNFQ